VSTVVLRPLSASERTEALNKAAAARATRAAAKESLKNGQRSAADIINAAVADEAMARMRVSELLEALPGIGKVRAAAIMKQLGIAASRRLRGLGVHQRAALVDFIDEN
jgi:DNA uptake protein ComE-like DNA-binding protein